MHIVRSKVHEERPVFVFLHKADGMGSDRISNVLILPECPASSLHVSDPADTVHDRHVMAVARLEVVEQFGIVAPGGLTGKILFITHLDRSRRIIVGYLAVLYKHTGYPVSCGCHDVMIIKSQVAQS